MWSEPVWATVGGCVCVEGCFQRPLFQGAAKLFKVVLRCLWSIRALGLVPIDSPD